MGLQKLSRPVLVSARDGADIQMLLQHPETKTMFSFQVTMGGAETTDPHVLRCLLDHPLRNQERVAGGFILIGADSELEKLYAEAMNQPAKIDEVMLLKEHVAELERKNKELEKKAAKATA